jgi:hypothetical protein
MNEQETPFRIGGVYFNGHGDGPWKIVASPRADVVFLEHARDRVRLTSGWCLADGRWEGSDRLASGMHLIPGELHEVDGRWVRVGAEKPVITKQTLDAVAQAQALWEDLYCDRNAAMIARDGKTTPRHLVKAILQDLATPVSTAKPNPFPNTLRSPDCDSGPSDHLNASRHQMAGMSD